MKNHKTDANYRPDIDGLRAIAVLTVVGFHAEIAAFAGGFVGVDVFFVISGFLITGIILEAIRKDTFSFAGFYTRRINRIFPALIVVVLATCVAGWGVLFPSEFESLGKHVIGGSTFVSNVMLWGEAGYFDSGAKPLLHLWSLAVEEQFYLVWPIVLVISWKRRWNLTGIVCAILVASFAAGIWQMNHFAGNAAFYLPGARFWEIASGALLCIAGGATTESRVQTSIGINTRHALSAAGLLLIVAALFVIDKDTPWPSWPTLIPVTGTLFLLAAGSDSVVNRWILGHRLLVGIGLISYPLYLWHWPVLVLARLVNDGQLTRTGRIGMVVLSIGLAAATYRAIESPIRFGAKKGRSAIRLTVAMIFVGLIGCAIYYQLVPARLTSPVKPEQMPQGGYFNNAGDAVGRVIKGDSSRVIAVVGDSHATQYRPRFEELARANPDKIPMMEFLTYGGCPPLPGVNRVGISWDGSPRRCDNFHRQVVEQLKSSRVGTVVILAYWEAYFRTLPIFFTTGDRSKQIQPQSAESDSVFRLFEKEIVDLRRAGKRVYIVLSNPTTTETMAGPIGPRRLPWLAARKPSLPVPRGPLDERTRWIDDRLRQVAQNTGAVVIDPMDFLCDMTSCPTSDNGVPRYADGHHLRPSFVRTRVTFLDAILAR